ncbi:MAG TPA: YiiD C-terminal domain-containing protein [Longimicrobiales bacterium]
MADQFGLEPYLHDHIPLSRHLGVRVEEAGIELVRLFAPLAPNLNHRKTGFGGSISALAILSGWSLLWCRMRERTSGQHIVIQKNTIEYVAPVTADFTATCAAPAAAEWERFLRTFEQRGRARIHLAATVDVGETLAARFSGRFAVLKR